MQICRVSSILIVFLLCVSASITDCREGKIYNKWILPLAGTGSLLNVIVLVMDSSCSAWEYLANILIVAGIAFLLFYSHTWAGGDSKLLIAVALTYPVTDYYEINGYRETLWMLLMATFCAGFLYIIADSLIHFVRKKNSLDKKGLWKNVKAMIYGYVQTLIYIMVFSNLYHYFVERWMEIPDGIYLLACILISFGIHRFPVFQERFLLAVALVFDVAMMVMTSFIPFSTDLRYYLLILAFMLIRAAAIQYNYQSIDTDLVKEGMILSRAQSLLMTKSRVKGLPGISDETLASRLTKEEAESIRRWKKTKNGQEKVTIVRKVPFAVFILMGVTAYMVAGWI